MKPFIRIPILMLLFVSCSHKIFYKGNSATGNCYLYIHGNSFVLSSYDLVDHCFYTQTGKMKPTKRGYELVNFLQVDTSNVNFEIKTEPKKMREVDEDTSVIVKVLDGEFYAFWEIRVRIRSDVYYPDTLGVLHLPKNAETVYFSSFLHGSIPCHNCFQDTSQEYSVQLFYDKGDSNFRHFDLYSPKVQVVKNGDRTSLLTDQIEFKLTSINTNSFDSLLFIRGYYICNTASDSLLRNFMRK